MTRADVAGADLSLTKSGLALGDGSLLTITPLPALKGYARLRPMAQAILERIGKRHRLIVIEGYDPHPLGALALVRAAELGGIIRAGLTELRVPFLDCPPSTLKKFATGKGNASKDDVLVAAELAGARPQTSDEADAYWLRRIGLELLGGAHNETLTKLELDLERLPDRP